MSGILFGVGTYILREEASRDLFGVLEKLKNIGCDGVELLGFFGKKTGEIRKKLDELGLRAMGDHIGVSAFLKDIDRVIAEHLEIGCETITIAHGEGEFVPGTTAYAGMLGDMRRLTDACRAAGLTPLYHNHGWDVIGSPSYAEGLLDALDGLGFEPDIGWMVYRDAQPDYYLKKYESRCPVLHFKDVYADDFGKINKNAPGSAKRDPANGGFEFRPTGYGSVNYPKLMPVCLACEPRWIIADHDLAYERDPYDDLRISVAYARALTEIAR